MKYDDLIHIYDDIDEYIMDQEIQSAKCESIEQKLIHEARASGASIALQILLRYASLTILEDEKKRLEKDKRIAEKLKRDNGYEYLV